MSDLRQLFANPFQRGIISDDALRIFTYDHLQRLASSNGTGHFNPRLTDTVTAFTAFGGQISGADLNRGLQIAATAEMYLRWNAFREWMMEEGEPRIASKAGQESPLYVRFLPDGLAELHRAALHQAGSILDRLAWLLSGDLSINGRLLGQEFVTRVMESQRAFHTARHAQLALRGELVPRPLDPLAARAALEIQLFDNLLALLQDFRRTPAAAMQFFSLSLLDHPILTAAAPTRVPVTLPS